MTFEPETLDGRQAQRLERLVS